jgi:transketolase
VRAEALRTLARMARADDRIVFLTGDLGFGVVEPFFAEFPDRAFNAGVAEQNMLAMATGLAERGLVPYVYSIATFVSLRPFEFIRNGPVVHRLPVRILGVGGGLEYSNNGPTHFALEDVGALRTLPGLSIVCPNDDRQAAAALEATKDRPGPVYLRLSKNEIVPAAGMPPGWDETGVHPLHQGDGSVAILALGAMVTELDAASAVLRAEGVDASTVAVSVVAPAPGDALAAIAERHRLVVTVEAHGLVGGLGTLVCEAVAERGLGTCVLRCAIEGITRGRSGSARWMLRAAGVDGETVGRRVVSVLQAAGAPAS